MIIYVITFNDEIRPKLTKCFKDDLLIFCNKDALQEAFYYHAPVIFVGSIGIAVRLIAPFVQDKSIDSPVIVMDSYGRSVIPLLSSHLGGALEISRKISHCLKAHLVVTTATDLKGLWACDVFALRNGLRIINKEKIKDISTRVLEGKQVGLYIDEGIEYKRLPKGLYITDESRSHIRIMKEVPLPGSSLDMVTKDLCVGLGCKKGVSFESINDFLIGKLKSLGYEKDRIYGFSSIDLKQKEEALLKLSSYYKTPIYFYSSSSLNKVKNSVSSSSFVSSVTGVDNVCERASLKLSGGELILPKYAEKGMTIALSKRKIILNWSTK